MGNTTHNCKFYTHSVKKLSQKNYNLSKQRSHHNEEEDPMRDNNMGNGTQNYNFCALSVKNFGGKSIIKVRNIYKKRKKKITREIARWEIQYKTTIFTLIP